MNIETINSFETPSHIEEVQEDIPHQEPHSGQAPKDGFDPSKNLEDNAKHRKTMDPKYFVPVLRDQNMEEDNLNQI